MARYKKRLSRYNRFIDACESGNLDVVELLLRCKDVK